MWEKRSCAATGRAFIICRRVTVQAMIQTMRQEVGWNAFYRKNLASAL